MENKIRFEKHFQKASFHNPMLGGKLDVQELEIRRDPLTGRQSVLNPSLKNKAAVLFAPSDPVLIDRLAHESESGCFLCSDRWRQTTPRYPEEMVTGGRVEMGESVLFPNLFALSKVHAVIRVGSSHYLPLRDFSPQLTEEAFLVSREFIRLLFHADNTVPFVTLNGNYLGPAGASVLHPHFQLLGSDVPFTHLEELLALSTAYHREHGACYWANLVAKEQELDARFITKTGEDINWITSFSPQGNNEVLGIFTEKRNILEMEDRDWSALAEGFSTVLRGYDSMGLSTFNFTLYSGPLGDRDEAFRCFLRIISRQNVYENYRTDDYFFQKLLRNELILTTPEELASILRNAFNHS
jgi:UDPglucose--hexose-1-phosphate uridylyltransferase